MLSIPILSFNVLEQRCSDISFFLLDIDIWILSLLFNVYQLYWHFLKVSFVFRFSPVYSYSIWLNSAIKSFFPSINLDFKLFYFSNLFKVKVYIIDLKIFPF